MRKFIGESLIYILLTILVVLTSGCKLEKEEVPGTMKIVCTTTIAADAVKNIVGDVSEVEILMGPGVDPHEYIPRQGDTKKLSDADVIVYHGLHLESKMTTHIEGLQKKKKPVINLGDAVSDDELIYGDGEGHKHNGHYHKAGLDPHVWNSVDIWIKCVRHLSNELGKIQPENKELFDKNCEEYIAELENMRSEIDSLYAQIPENRRVLVTAHDAFGYLARTHNLKTRSLQGVSTTAEFGIKDVTDLADFLVNKKINAIFLETSVPDKNLLAVINNCKSNGHDVQIGGVLYSDALGISKDSSETYIKMMKRNAETIVNALK